MPQGFPLLGHIAVGSAAILLYWATLLTVKGGPRHRTRGKAFFAILLVVSLSVAPLLFFRPAPFDPASLVQFVYLTLCLLAVTTVGWTAIRWKNDLARFRGTHFRVSGVVLLLLGCVVLFAGLAEGSVLTVGFSWIGLVYGGAMIRFAWMKAAPHPRWSMIWHLNAVCGLFNAVHGTFLAVVWRMAVDPDAGDGTGAAMQLLTVLTALWLRLWFGARRGAPLRLTLPAATPALPA